MRYCITSFDGSLDNSDKVSAFEDAIRRIGDQVEGVIALHDLREADTRPWNRFYI